MIVTAQITKIEITKTKKGHKCVYVCVKTDSADSKYTYVREYIGGGSGVMYITRWWDLIGQDLGFSGFLSENAFDLIGVCVAVELEWDEQWSNPKIKAFVDNAATSEVPAAPAPAPTFAPAPAPAPAPVPAGQIPQDDIPF